MSNIFRRGLTWWVDLRRYNQGRRSLETRDKREAEVRARRLERAAWEGKVIEASSGGPTLAVAFERAMSEHKGWRNSKSPETIRIHFRALTKHYGEETRLGSIDRDRAREWAVKMDKAGLSGSTINARLAILGVLREVYDLDPLRVPNRGGSKGRQRVITQAELEGVLGYFDRRSWRDMASLVRFLRETGARLGEALATTAESIDPEIPAVVLPTSKRDRDGNRVPRVIPLTRGALAAISGLPAAGKLWPALTNSIVAKRWAEARKAVGLEKDEEFVPHALRHTKATEITKRHGIKAAQVWLGHSTISTTSKYSHLDVSEIIKLAERHTSGDAVPGQPAVPAPVSVATR